MPPSQPASDPGAEQRTEGRRNHQPSPPGPCTHGSHLRPGLNAPAPRDDVHVRVPGLGKWAGPAQACTGAVLKQTPLPTASPEVVAPGLNTSLGDHGRAAEDPTGLISGVRPQPRGRRPPPRVDQARMEPHSPRCRRGKRGSRAAVRGSPHARKAAAPTRNTDSAQTLPKRPGPAGPIPSRGDVSTSYHGAHTARRARALGSPRPQSPTASVSGSRTSGTRARGPRWLRAAWPPAVAVRLAGGAKRRLYRVEVAVF
jgi:hypothetical protein